VFSGYGPSSKVSATAEVPVVIADPPGPDLERELGETEGRGVAERDPAGVGDGDGEAEGELDGDDDGEGEAVGDWGAFARGGVLTGVHPAMMTSSSGTSTAFDSSRT
jgi:hypothetical protein